MAFKVSDVESCKFNNIKGIEEYAANEIESIKYIPISEYMENDSMFMGDELYGRGKEWVNFNSDGFSSFCSLLRIPLYFLNELTQPNLVSIILNDYLLKPDIKEKMANYYFVIDTSKKIVLGIVSNTYQRYYIMAFLNDLKEYFPEIYDKFEISESYVINTKLYLRFLSPKIKAGLITGKGGTADDESKIGLQLSNSLIGDSSIKIQIYILRLICANGLTAESLNSKGLVMHSGKQDTFIDRLEAIINPFVNNLKTVPNILKELSNIEYIPESIVEVGGADAVYNIIPLNAEMNLKRKRLKEDKLKEFDIVTITSYPKKYAGEYSGKVFNSYYRDNYNMYDFINVFTEYAHSKDKILRNRLEIENKTGELVNWIIKNKNKIVKQNKEVLGRPKQMSFMN